MFQVGAVWLSAGMGGAALPENLGVGAADVIGVQRQRVDQPPLARELVSDLADPRREDRGNHFDCFTCGESRRPLCGLREALGIGRNPGDALAARLPYPPIQEFLWSADQL